MPRFTADERNLVVFPTAMTTLSSDDISRLAHDLVYQVAYSFYDTPYILLLKLLVNLGVYAPLPLVLSLLILGSRANERSLAELVGLSPNDLRRYMGTLHVHRLVKRCVSVSLASQWNRNRLKEKCSDM